MGGGGGRGGRGGRGGAGGAKKRKASNIYQFNAKNMKHEINLALSKWPASHVERVEPAYQIRRESLNLFLRTVQVQMSALNGVFEKNLKELYKLYRKSSDSIINQNITKCVEHEN